MLGQFMMFLAAYLLPSNKVTILTHLDPPGPTLTHLNPIFWKMFRMVWNSEKTGFWKMTKLPNPPDPPWPTSTLILKNVHNGLKWRENMFLENDLTVQPTPTHLSDPPWPTLDMTDVWGWLPGCSHSVAVCSCVFWFYFPNCLGIWRNPGFLQNA